MRKLFIDESGQGLTEYIIMVLLVAIAAITIVRLFGTQISGAFTDARNAIRDRVR